MNKTELIDYFLKSPMFCKWHWFQYHFDFYNKDKKHPFAEILTSALLDCELKKPGIAKPFADKIITINGREKNQDHFHQLISVLAEIHVIRQALRCPHWGKSVKFFYEPTVASRGKNPELGIQSEKQYVGIEVKCPALKNHILHRKDHAIQLPYRIPELMLKELQMRISADLEFPMEQTKDFLISADEKFAEFHVKRPDFLGILVILWDDCVFEVLGPLLNVASGLLTPKTYATRMENGVKVPIIVKNVDGIIIVPHYSNLYDAPVEHPRPMPDFQDSLDYGGPGSMPPIVFVQNPLGKPVPQEVLRCFHAKDYKTIDWANYQMLDFILWLNLPERRRPEVNEKPEGNGQPDKK